MKKYPEIETRNILNALLDRFERSRHASEKGSSNRRVMLRLSAGDFAPYVIEDAETRNSYNNVIIALSEADFLDFKWVRGRRNFVIDQVWLNLENVDEAYKLIDREQKSNVQSRLVSIYDGTGKELTSDWMRGFFDGRIQTLSEPHARLRTFEKNEKIFRALLIALKEYDKLNDSLSVRAFSIKCYSDSKYFEKNIMNYFLDICRNHEPALNDAIKYNDFTKKEQLSSLGLTPMNETFEFSGPISISTDMGTIDFSIFDKSGAAVTSQFACEIKDIDMPGISDVIFIENKTCYEEAVSGRFDVRKTSENFGVGSILYVNHGGFLTTRRKAFFKLIYENTLMHKDKKIMAEADVSIYDAEANSSPAINFWHWGDMDIGGIYMHIQLKSIIPELKPLCMDAGTFEKFKDFGVEHDYRYFEKLSQMQLDSRYATFSDMISAILKYKVTVEQEALLAE